VRNVAPRRLLTPSEEYLDRDQGVIALSPRFDVAELALDVLWRDLRELLTAECEVTL